MKFFAPFILLVTFATANVTNLTTENYDELTSGKVVFIKFFAPWCGHCKKMAPDWEKLAEDWKEHETVLIAEVDCTADGKDFCNTNRVKAFPALKYGDPANLDTYEGARSYDALKTFSEENLKLACSPRNIDLCSDEERTQIETLTSKIGPELNKLIKDEKAKLKEIEKSFEKRVKQLQDDYASLTEKKDKAIKELKDSGLVLMQSVRGANRAKMIHEVHDDDDDSDDDDDNDDDNDEEVHEEL
mmetsp:Transcript_40726/g.59828  ORF Transcript_40726/g.59828 Transcript_40726/m.59828 type:complete len:244 (-) Transcript_40726:342-1073(-)